MRGISPVLIVCLASAVVNVSPASSQQTTQMRTRAIVASLSKSKHAIKERHGIRVEKYKEIRSAAVARSNLQSLSGTYEVQDLGLVLHLRVDANGRVQGDGVDPLGDDVYRIFTLSNAKVDGALLTATKVYARGGSAPLEGVFINMTSYDSPSDRGHTEFGLGVIDTPIAISGVTVDKFFYRFRK